MLENSFNLVDMIRGYLTGEAIGRMSSLIGENSDRTRSGIAAAIPGILTGLDGAASTSDGARRINAAIDDADGSMLDSLLGTFGKSSTGDAGSGILRSILGVGGLTDLANSVGRASGISGRSTTSLIGLLAPIVFAVLARLKRSAGSGFDIAGLLAGQRANIAAAMPEGEETYAGPRVAPREREAEAYTRPPTARSTSQRPSWILPLALLAGGIGLLWLWAAGPHASRAAYEDVTPRTRTMISLDVLKAKYDSVMQEARAQGVRITDVRLQNDRLMIKGIAPSQEAADKVWAEIRRVNPAVDDIIADFQIVSTSSSTESSPTPESAVTESTSGMYTVKRGDTLRSISKHFYGNTQDYKRIYEANRETVGNENVISVGQELSIPMERTP